MKKLNLIYSTSFFFGLWAILATPAFSREVDNLTTTKAYNSEAKNLAGLMARNDQTDFFAVGGEAIALESASSISTIQQDSNRLYRANFTPSQAFGFETINEPPVTSVVYPLFRF